MNLNILINRHSNLNIIKKNKGRYLIIFNENFFIKYKLSNNFKLFFSKNCWNLNLKTWSVVISASRVESLTRSINSTIGSYFLKKITFKGKSYKIKKKRKFFFLTLNKAHFEIINWNNFFFKKIKKNKMIVKGSSAENINRVSNLIINLRKINIFNRRGLKITKSILLKKRGKKASS